MRRPVILSCCIFLCATLGYSQQEHDLGTIFITATKEETEIDILPSNIDAVSFDGIRASGSENVAEVLKDIAGVVEVSDRGTLGAARDVRMRGGGDSSARVLVLIDGRMINDISQGPADLSKVPVANIDRIEIMRGAYSSLYGANALNGVINIITKRASSDMQLDIGSSWGTFDLQDYNLGLGQKIGDYDYYFTAGKKRSLGYRQNSDYDSENFSLKLGCGYKNIGDLIVDAGYYSGKLGVPGTSISVDKYDGITEKLAQDPDAQQKDEDMYVNIRHKKGVFSDAALNSKIYFTKTDRRYTSPFNFTDDESSTDVLGIEMFMSSVYGFLLGMDMRIEAFEQSDYTSAIPEKITDKENNNRAFFIQRPLYYEKTTYILGLRYDNHSIYGGQLNPSFSSAYRLAPSMKISANLGRAYRAPSFEDLYSPYRSWLAWGPFPGGDSKGNDGLKPESGWSYDLGFEYRYNDGFKGGITFYRNDVQDFIQWSNISTDPDYDKWRPSNIGKVYSQGIEVELFGRITDMIKQTLNYTLLDTKGKIQNDAYNEYLVTNGKAGGGSYSIMQYSPMHQLNYKLIFDFVFGMRTALSMKYVDARWNVNGWEFDGFTEYKLPSYTVFDLMINQKLWHTDIFVAVNNIFDKKYQSRYEYPLPGRNFEVGLRARF